MTVKQEAIYDFMVGAGYTTERELGLVKSAIGTWEDTFKHIIYYFGAYNDIDQFLAEEYLLRWDNELESFILIEEE